MNGETVIANQWGRTVTLTDEEIAFIAGALCYLDPCNRDSAARKAIVEPAWELLMALKKVDGSFERLHKKFHEGQP